MSKAFDSGQLRSLTTCSFLASHRAVLSSAATRSPSPGSEHTRVGTHRYVCEVKGNHNVVTGVTVKALANPGRGCKMQFSCTARWDDRQGDQMPNKLHCHRAGRGPADGRLRPPEGDKTVRERGVVPRPTREASRCHRPAGQGKRYSMLTCLYIANSAAEGHETVWRQLTGRIRLPRTQTRMQVLSPATRFSSSALCSG